MISIFQESQRRKGGFFHYLRADKQRPLVKIEKTAVQRAHGLICLATADKEIGGRHLFGKEGKVFSAQYRFVIALDMFGAQKTTGGQLDKSGFVR